LITLLGRVMEKAMDTADEHKFADDAAQKAHLDR
jgi:hypothetical protein